MRLPITTMRSGSMALQTAVREVSLNEVVVAPIGIVEFDLNSGMGPLELLGQFHPHSVKIGGCSCYPDLSNLVGRCDVNLQRQDRRGDWYCKELTS
ncbi:hypothetical protein B5P45_12470 [Phyllobacterium zundukense]|uniref:Uncharacterized protein n=1 Tax=Phyllobacterium zundukense TaxID=1867719 RepID=A0A2N9VYU2_9HYPH|nr:hypothetical protein BLM14_26315 [Phyllobacterium zundukense]PIO44660.1 hypothetical protein B5P45_12470 [Phyllobacterium zundukense]